MAGATRLVVLVQVVSMLLVGVSGSVLAALTAAAASGPATPAAAASGPSSSATGAGSAREASAVADASGVRQVDSCTRITEPGVYVLEDDLTNATATEDTGVRIGNESVRACVLVASSDVVLSGSGNVIDGEGGEDVDVNETLDASAAATERSRYALGVAVRGENGSSLSNVTVTDVTTRDWSVGTLVENTTNATLFEGHASENAAEGIALLGGEDGFVVESSADRNGFAGLFASRTTNLSVVDSTFGGNDVVGVDVFFGNAGTTLVNASVSNSSVAGVAAVQSAGTVLSGSTATDVGGDDSVLSGSYVFVNASDAVVLDSGTRNDGSWAMYATDCENAPGVCVNETVVDGDDTTVFAEALAVGDATVSFSGENVAVGAVDALASNASPADGIGLGDGLVVTNTTADAFVGLSTTWAGDRHVHDGQRTVPASTANESTTNGTASVATVAA